MKFKTQILPKLSKTISLLITLFFALPLSAQYISPVYTVDSDYDGVPNVRDKCPTTPELIQNFELAQAVTIKGKKVIVVFRNVRKNFEMRRRRLLIKKSRWLKKIRKADETTTPSKSTIMVKIKALDSLIKRPAIYDVEVTIHGKQEMFSIPIDVDEFGCLPDDDGDGIPNIVDKCPEKPGTRKLKGCPPEKKKDRDGDSIIDEEDLCPDKPGPKKNKGCPEILKKEEEEILKKASKVLFAFSKADIKPISFPILDQVVALLHKYPKSNIHMEGHTDNVGKDENNMTLSKNRAASVRKYFIDKGIKAPRITSEGHGEIRPIDTNSTS